MGNRPKRKPRVVRTDVWRRPVADPSSAIAALDEARGHLVLAGIGQTDREQLQPLQDAVDEAQKAVEACFETVPFHAIRGEAFEALMAEHPPTEAELVDDLTHHDATFLPALLEACCENEWTAEDWAEELGEMSAGEKSELRQLVTHLNTRTWSAQIPKG